MGIDSLISAFRLGRKHEKGEGTDEEYLNECEEAENYSLPEETAYVLGIATISPCELTQRLYEKIRTDIEELCQKYNFFRKK